MPTKAKTTTKKTSKKQVARKSTSAKARTAKTAKKNLNYFEAIGRRKTATARVRLFTQKKKDIQINQKPYQDYFPVLSLQKTVIAPLKQIKCQDKFGVSVKVRGGGLSGQAEATRLGIARALVLVNPYFRKRLKKAGFLTRDPRMRERKKFGLKRARRAPQWSKR